MDTITKHEHLLEVERSYWKGARDLVDGLMSAARASGNTSAEHAYRQMRAIIDRSEREALGEWEVVQ